MNGGVDQDQQQPELYPSSIGHNGIMAVAERFTADVKWRKLS